MKLRRLMAAFILITVSACSDITEKNSNCSTVLCLAQRFEIKVRLTNIQGANLINLHQTNSLEVKNTLGANIAFSIDSSIVQDKKLNIEIPNNDSVIVKIGTLKADTLSIKKSAVDNSCCAQMTINEIKVNKQTYCRPCTETLVTIVR